MENVTLSETVGSPAHEPFTEHDIVLWRTVSLVLQSILIGAFLVKYWIARSALLDGLGPLKYVEQRNLVYLRAMTAMLGLALANFSASLLVTMLPAAGYEGKLGPGTPYDKFSDKYALFMSVNGVQFYLYVTQTMVADGLLIYTLYAKSNGNPKACSHAVGGSILATLFGYLAFSDGLWAFQFLCFTTVAVNLLSSGPMMQASLRDSSLVRKSWEWRPAFLLSFLRSRDFADAAVQSAALYTLASFSLPVTFLIDTNILFYTNMSVLSPLMGIVFSNAVISWSCPASADEPYIPWTQQSQLGMPPATDTEYTLLTAPLEGSPALDV